MIRIWDNLPPPQARDLFYEQDYGWSPQLVILEYDGPQMVTTNRRSGRCIALAVDESDDGNTVRWIEAPLSNLDYEALVRGASSIRTAFEQETIRVIDYSSNFEPTAVYELDSLALPDGALPEPGVLLPDAVRQRLLPQLKSQQEAPLFTLESSAAAGGGVLFKALGAGMTRLQALFDELSSSLQLGPVPLAATAFAPGSLKVNVHVPNPIAFNRVAEDYEGLARITDDADKLAALLDEHYSPEIGAAYRAYLGVLAEHKIKVLAQWRDRSCFVAYGSVRRIGAPSAILAPADPEPEPNPEPEYASGYFIDFWAAAVRGAGFQFIEVGTGKKFEGAVHRNVVERVAQERASGTFTMGLGERSGTKYTITLQVTEVPGKPDKYLLLDYQETPSGADSDPSSAPVRRIRL